MGDAPLDHAAAVAALKGQTLRVPDLWRYFAGWPAGRANRHYPAPLQPRVDAAILRIAAAQPLLERRLRDDLARLTALWYPDADEPAACALGLFAVWLFLWDDAVDANEGDLAGDYDRAEAWRAATLRTARAALGLGGDEAGALPSDAISAALLEFGASFAASSAPAQRQRAYDEVALFVRCCAQEQDLRLRGRIPGYDAYLEMRIGTVAGQLLCALVPYANGLRPLAPAVAESAHARALERQVSIILGLSNDVLSLKKELSTDCVINVVAALLGPGRTLDQVVDEVCGKIADAARDFDAAGEDLLRAVGGDAEAVLAARKFIDGCRFIVTGTLDFTLTSPRYGIFKLLREDGSLEIVL
ncbi:hypothetical protein S40288_09327 [Stachybotrys chartarum IBT 40288]|nr:hypothetical protein S40288_09327 [Stachybotrys chartarum IBT 40288]